MWTIQKVVVGLGRHVSRKKGLRDGKHAREGEGGQGTGSLQLKEGWGEGGGLF